MGVHAGGAEYEAIKNILEIPVDEPIFIIRAQDVCAYQAIQDYSREASARGAGPQFLDGVRRCVDQVSDWQVKNSDKVKVPD